MEMDVQVFAMWNLTGLAVVVAQQLQINAIPSHLFILSLLR